MYEHLVGNELPMTGDKKMKGKRERIKDKNKQ